MKTAIFITALTLGSVALSQAATTLIEGSTNNGNFDADSLSNGTTLKLNTGNVSSWTGTATAEIMGTQFTNELFLYNALDTATNMTSYIITAGDTFSYSIHYLELNEHGPVTIGLASKDPNGLITKIQGSEQTADQSNNNSTFSFIANSGDAWIGHNIGLYLEGNSTDWIRLDNATLTVTAVPEPSSAALLGLGGLALIFRRRKG